jgi:hypothetical protein
MTLDGRWWPVLNCYGRKHREETAMSVEKMNKTGDFSEFCDMGKVSLVILLQI